MILFDGVTKRFGKRAVLQDIELEIKPGEFVSLVGPSGAGKTTLMKLLLAAEQPSEGRLLVHNHDISAMQGENLQRYRRNLGVIFQDAKLLPNRTAYENVAFPLEACDYAAQEIAELVPQALKMLGIEHLQDQFPSELSGGEAKLVALARAIVHKPKLVLADEPTANLDLENAKHVLKNLVKINLSGITVIFATHNRPLVDLIGQKVVHLQAGKLLL